MRQLLVVLATLGLTTLVPRHGQIVAAQSVATRRASDTLPLRHTPIGNLLQLGIGELAAIEINPAFSYLGGQRFILGGTADAEQHLFVVADSGQTVRRLFWIQIEELLPTRSGSYNYSADSSVTIQGVSLAANVRVYSTRPDPSSDRARAFDLVESHGFRVPHGAMRVRLIYLPERSARREIMIVYLEPMPVTESEAGFGAALLSRATSGLVLHRIP